jgi:hypothetical protein
VGPVPLVQEEPGAQAARGSENPGLSG